MNLQPPDAPEDTRTDYEIGLDEGRTEQATEIAQTQADIERALYALTESETENDTLKAEIAELKAKLANAKSEVAVLKQGLGVRMKSWQK
jgi:peptidoglycan hydrolase CwlO-like protein